MRSSGFTHRAFGPGLRSAPPSPSPRAARPPALLGLAFGRRLIPGGAQVGGPVAGKAPRTDFHAFLPCSLRRSKKNPKARINCAVPLPLLSAPLFLLSQVSQSCPEGGQHRRGTCPVGAGGRRRITNRAGPELGRGRPAFRQRGGPRVHCRGPVLDEGGREAA